MKKRHLAFAGFRHTHILAIYRMAQNHERFTIMGACEPHAESRRKAESAGVLFTHDNYETLFNDPNIDIIVIGDCYANRGALSLAALNHGKHVISDKPLCTSLDQLDQIEETAQKRGLSVSCMFSMRYDPIVEAAKEAVQQIGSIRSAYFGGQHPLLYGSRPSWYYEASKYGGLFNDLAIHGVDLIYYLTGQRIRSVTAARCYNAYAKHERDFPDSGQFMAVLENGAGLIADVSYSIPDSVGYALPFYWQFYLWGDNGVVSFSANSDGVICCLNQEKNTLCVSPRPTPTDYLSDVYDMLDGHPTVLTMEDVFAATRDTLTIQKVAVKEDIS